MFNRRRSPDRAGNCRLDQFEIGRPVPKCTIYNGEPFGIGNQMSLTIPATGTLYLGVNDDNVSDNSGQFQVVISR